VRRAAFQPTFSEDASNPKFRPSIDLLMTKLRGLSPLQNKPEAVELVVEDLLHHYFLREKKRPDNLWHVAAHAVYMWQMAMGLPRGDQLNTVMADEEPQPLPLSTSPEAPDLSDSQLKLGSKWLLASHYPMLEDRDTGRVTCYCEKEFDGVPAWAHHVRSRLWKYIREDFPNREEMTMETQ